MSVQLTKSVFGSIQMCLPLSLLVLVAFCDMWTGVNLVIELTSVQTVSISLVFLVNTSKPQKISKMHKIFQIVK